MERLEFNLRDAHRRPGTGRAPDLLCISWLLNSLTPDAILLLWPSLPGSFLPLPSGASFRNGATTATFCTRTRHAPHAESSSFSLACTRFSQTASCGEAACSGEALSTLPRGASLRGGHPVQQQTGARDPGAVRR